MTVAVVVIGLADEEVGEGAGIDARNGGWEGC